MPVLLCLYVLLLTFPRMSFRFSYIFWLYSNFTHNSSSMLSKQDLFHCYLWHNFMFYITQLPKYSQKYYWQWKVSVIFLELHLCFSFADSLSPFSVSFLNSFLFFYITETSHFFSKLANYSLSWCVVLPERGNSLS